MSQAQAFSSPNPILLLALNKVIHLLRRLDAALQRRIQRRSEAAAALADAVPHAMLGLWAAAQGAMMVSPGDALKRTSSSAAASVPSLPPRIGNGLWRLLEQAGERRARRELSSLARQHEVSRPEFAARLREAAQRGWL